MILNINNIYTTLVKIQWTSKMLLIVQAITNKNNNLQTLNIVETKRNLQKLKEMSTILIISQQKNKSVKLPRR